MKTAIVYASVHHGNTKKLVEAIAAQAEDVTLIDAAKTKEMDLKDYDVIGFASGIYYSKFHQSVLNFASVNMPEYKNTFFICTVENRLMIRSYRQWRKRRYISLEPMDAKVMIHLARLN